MNNNSFPLKKSGQEIRGLLRIGVDIDQNIIDLIGKTRTIVLEKLGLDINDHKNFYIEEWPELKKVPGGPRFIRNLFLSPFVYQEAEPIPGAIETLNKWQTQGHELWFITARTEMVRQVTLDWFEKNKLGWAKPKIVFRKSPKDSRENFKQAHAKRLNLHAFIEDQAEAVRQISSDAMMIKLILKYRWNIDEEIGEKAKFVDSWQQIDQIIQETSLAHSLSQDIFISP